MLREPALAAEHTVLVRVAALVHVDLELGAAFEREDVHATGEVPEEGEWVIGPARGPAGHQAKWVGPGKGVARVPELVRRRGKAERVCCGVVGVLRVVVPVEVVVQSGFAVVVLPWEAKQARHPVTVGRFLCSPPEVSSVAPFDCPVQRDQFSWRANQVHDDRVELLTSTRSGTSAGPSAGSGMSESMRGACPTPAHRRNRFPTAARP